MLKTTSRLSHVRNFGVVAYVDAGKIRLTEPLIYCNGALHKIGGVQDGAARMDPQAEEQRQGITITSALIRAPWREHQLQLIDTSGCADFTIEVEHSMRVLDGCAGSSIRARLYGVSARASILPFWSSSTRWIAQGPISQGHL